MAQRKRYKMQIFKFKYFYTGMTCALCKRKIGSMDHSSIDHKIPISRGGSDEYFNYQIVHKTCNHDKKDKIYLRYVYLYSFIFLRKLKAKAMVLVKRAPQLVPVIAQEQRRSRKRFRNRPNQRPQQRQHHRPRRRSTHFHKHAQ